MKTIEYQNLAVSCFGGFNRGVGQSWLNTVKGLDKEFKISIIKNDFDFCRSYSMFDLHEDLKRFEISPSIIKYNISWDKYLQNDYLLNSGSQVIHAWDNIPVNCNIRQVVTVHDTFLFADKYKELGYSKYDNNEIIKELFYRNVDIIACPSVFTREDVIEFLPKFNQRNIKVIPWGSKFGYTLVKQNFAKWNKNKNYLLYVGAIEGRKNFDSVVRAHKLLRDKGIDIQLVIVTDLKAGLSKNDVLNAENLLHELKHHNIKIYSNLPDYMLKTLYLNAIALIFPSILEGFGLPVVEALSLGCDVICSNSSALKEFGEYVKLVNPEEPQELADMIERVARNKEGITFDMYKELESKYNYAKTQKDYSDIYKELL